MRAPGNLGRAGLSAAAVVVLLTGCGGSDEEPAASSTSSSSAAGSSSAGGGTDEVAAFCSEAMALENALTQQISDAATNDPTTVPAVLRSAADQYQAIDPPAEIEADWQLLSQSAQDLSDMAQAVDFSQPGALDQFASSLAVEEQSAIDANDHVQTYVDTNCAAG